MVTILCLNLFAVISDLKWYKYFPFLCFAGISQISHTKHVILDFEEPPEA